MKIDGVKSFNFKILLWLDYNKEIICNQPKSYIQIRLRNLLPFHSESAIFLLILIIICCAHKKLCVIIWASAIITKLVYCVRQIIDSHQKSDSDKLNREIESLVWQLYGITDKDMEFLKENAGFY